MVNDINNNNNKKDVCLVAQTVKNLPAMQKTQVWPLGWKDPLEKGMATTPVFFHPGEFCGQSLEGYSPWGHKELDATKRLLSDDAEQFGSLIRTGNPGRESTVTLSHPGSFLYEEHALLWGFRDHCTVSPRDLSLSLWGRLMDTHDGQIPWEQVSLSSGLKTQSPQHHCPDAAILGHTVYYRHVVFKAWLAWASLVAQW